MLINPVGILRRHQREVRRSTTTMTKTSTTAKATKPTTLEKMWSTMKNKDNDVVMEDEETKTPEEIIDYIKRNQEKTEKSANDDDYENYGPVETTTRYEFSIRIRIKADNEEDAHKQHRNLMTTISKEMKQLKLYSKNNTEIEPTEATIDDFQYHEVGKNTKYFIVVHGVEQPQPYHKLKQNKTIFEALKTNHCFIYKHVWDEQEWNIVTIGFLSGVSPRHQAKYSIKKQFNTAKEGPKYEIGATTIKTNMNDETFTTFAYEVKCMQKDLADVCDYLATTGPKLDVTLIKHKWKYSNPEVYINGIKKQNEYAREIRTIPIYGISRDAMDHLDEKLRSNNHIIDISPTSRTTTHGRWNAYTTAKHFEKTTKWLIENLQEMFDRYCKNMISTSNTPQNFIPEVKFNSTISFPAPQKDPHIDNATSAVSKYNSSQAHSWASVVRGYRGYTVTTKPTSQATSPISSISEFATTLQNITLSIERICKRLDKIESRLEEQDKTLQKVQQFEVDTHSNMEKLTSILMKLEERTTRIIPRRLDNTFESMEPNKRQDTRCSPNKGSQRM